ncbi:MAG: putative membrane protein [Hyphomicrobiaceae bacterium]
MIRLRNLFIAGLIVLVPVVLTASILQFLFGLLDGISQPLVKGYLGREVSGVGAMLTAVIILLLGYFSTLFVGQRIVEAFEYWVARIPIVRSVYSTTRQVVRGFSSNEGMNFQRTVLVAREDDILMFGFVTGDFSLTKAGEEQRMCTVYVPTNHLYLGDVFVVPAELIIEVDMTLEEGISAVLSCGGSLPDDVRLGARTVTDQADETIEVGAGPDSIPS